jgi:hypothetical protein
MVLGWASLILWLTGRLGGKEAPLIFFGTFFAWLYLRFFMRDGESGVVGDLRPEFSLATFFPDVFGLRPLVEFAGTVVFQSLFRLGLFAETVKSNASLPTTAETAALNPSQSHANAALAGAPGDLYRTVDPTAERRRLLAIKAIDDKLAELARQPNNNMMMYPDMNLALNAGGGTQPTNGVDGVSAGSQSNGNGSLTSPVTLPSEEELATMEAALAPTSSTSPEQ